MTPTSSRDDLLIVDDLMLLLMDDDGASVQGAATLYYTLGGALLSELALLGRVEVDDTGILNGPRVTPVGEGPLGDPLLQSAYETVAEKTQRVQPLLLALGADLWRVVIDRLVDRGLLRREESRRFGVFRSTRWPAADEQHEAQLRARIRRVLEDREEPDPRTAAIIGLLYASGAMPTLRPPRHGDSPVVPTYTVASTADALTDLVVALDVGPAAVVATSFAPAATVWAAAQHPELFAGLVAISPHLQDDHFAAPALWGGRGAAR